jgi:predicted small integral membrane protein
MPALRIVKSLLVATLGGWALLVAYGNIADYNANWQFVQHVLAMDTVFPDNPLKSRAITDPALQPLAYWSVIATEWVMGLVCLYGAWRLFRARGDRQAFVAAKVPATIGIFVAWLLYFVGFVAVGGEWFSMWQSSIWNGQQTAQRFLASAMFVMVVVLLPEESDA